MNVVALSGGVGGAKLCLGLYEVLSGDDLTIVANTADDFIHWGLPISPDLDTVMYTLAGLSNTQQGWGLEGETWHCMESMKLIGAEDWFQLGDKDLATHIHRRSLLDEGYSLTSITAMLCEKLKVDCALLPMTNQRVSTMVQTADGELGFQEYFVKHRCEPRVRGFRFDNIEHAEISLELRQAINALDLLIVCPSNPFVSVDPILGVPGLKELMLKKTSPRIVVSPIVSGMALKGPAAKMMEELSIPVSVLEVARYYQDFATHIVLDSSDEKFIPEIRAIGMEVISTDTVMKTKQDKINLAHHILEIIKAS